MSRSCGRPADEIWAIGNSGDTIASATGAPAISSMAPTVAMTRPRDCSLRIARRWWRRRDTRHASDSLVRVVGWRNGPTLVRLRMLLVIIRSTSPPEAELWGTFGAIGSTARLIALREPALNELGPKALVCFVAYTLTGWPNPSTTVAPATLVGGLLLARSAFSP